MTVCMRFESGATATLLHLSGDAVSLESTHAAPPGSRLSGTSLGDEIRIKVHQCRKISDGCFRIEGRCIDLSKAVREKLLLRLEPSR